MVSVTAGATLTSAGTQVDAVLTAHTTVQTVMTLTNCSYVPEARILSGSLPRRSSTQAKITRAVRSEADAEEPPDDERTAGERRGGGEGSGKESGKESGAGKGKKSGAGSGKEAAPYRVVRQSSIADIFNECNKRRSASEERGGAKGEEGGKSEGGGAAGGGLASPLLKPVRRTLVALGPVTATSKDASSKDASSKDITAKVTPTVQGKVSNATVAATVPAKEKSPVIDHSVEVTLSLNAVGGKNAANSGAVETKPLKMEGGGGSRAQTGAPETVAATGVDEKMVIAERTGVVGGGAPVAPDRQHKGTGHVTRQQAEAAVNTPTSKPPAGQSNIPSSKMHGEPDKQVRSQPAGSTSSQHPLSSTVSSEPSEQTCSKPVSQTPSQPITAVSSTTLCQLPKQTDSKPAETLSSQELKSSNTIVDPSKQTGNVLVDALPRLKSNPPSNTTSSQPMKQTCSRPSSSPSSLQSTAPSNAASSPPSGPSDAASSPPSGPSNAASSQPSGAVCSKSVVSLSQVWSRPRASSCATQPPTSPMIRSRYPRRNGRSTESTSGGAGEGWNVTPPRRLVRRRYQSADRGPGSRERATTPPPTERGRGLTRTYSEGCVAGAAVGAPEVHRPALPVMPAADSLPRTKAGRALGGPLRRPVFSAVRRLKSAAELMRESERDQRSRSASSSHQGETASTGSGASRAVSCHEPVCGASGGSGDDGMAGAALGLKNVGQVRRMSDTIGKQAGGATKRTRVSPHEAAPLGLVAERTATYPSRQQRAHKEKRRLFSWMHPHHHHNHEAQVQDPTGAVSSLCKQAIAVDIGPDGGADAAAATATHEGASTLERKKGRSKFLEASWLQKPKKFFKTSSK